MNLAPAAILSIGLLAVMTNADTAGRSSSPHNDGTAAPSPKRSLNYSSWIYARPIRNGVVSFDGRDFYDTYFQYRWKSDWVLNHNVCTVEIRPAEDAPVSRTVPEITVEYFSSQSIEPHVQMFKAQNVSIGSKAFHAYIRPSDCDRVGFVFWKPSK
jgi:hypothetical protein